MTEPWNEDEVVAVLTNGQPYTRREAKRLAFLIWERFGQDNEAAAAWRRMLQNNCSDQQYMELVQEHVRTKGDR